MLQLRQIRTSVNAPRVSEDAVLAARAGGRAGRHRSPHFGLLLCARLAITADGRTAETPRDPQSVADLPHFLLCL